MRYLFSFPLFKELGRAGNDFDEPAWSGNAPENAGSIFPVESTFPAESTFPVESTFLAQSAFSASNIPSDSTISYEPDFYQSAAKLKSLGFAARVDQYDPWTEDEATEHLLQNIFGFK